MKAARLGTACAILVVAQGISAFGAEKEVSLSSEELKKLDTFEGHTLAKADAAFAKKQYRQARAEYDSFILEFPRSKVIPYALLRKGRCAQLDDKRFKAVADYEEVLDYFPNAVKYAATALYYEGECHWQNGDLEKAVKAWAEIADDEEYREEFLAAPAINKLADNLMKREKEAEAVKYYEQVAVTFRTKNADASKHATAPVILYHTRTMPNEPKLREFYTKMRGFGQHPANVPKDLTSDKAYWDEVRKRVGEHGTFAALQKDLRKKYYAHWSGRLKGKFLDDDDFQIDLASFRYLAEDNRANWFAFLDKQYQRLQKPNDWKRIFKWMNVYQQHPKKIEEYYKKIDLAKVDNAGILSIMRFFWVSPDTRPLAKGIVSKLKFDQISNAEKGSLALEFHEENQALTTFFLGKIKFSEMPGSQIGALAVSFFVKDHGLSRHILGKINFPQMPDGQIAGLAGAFWSQRKGEADKLGVEVANRIREVNFRKNTLLGHYHERRNGAAGLPLATDMTRVDKYAKAAWWKKAEFLDWSKKYAEAIAAYKNCENEPENLWRIANCLVQLGKLETAVTQVREIEGFFKDQAPKAAMHIAQLYRNAGEKKKYIAALRAVLKKYAGSGQSRQAHLELEEMGIKMGGGVDAD